MKLPVTGWLLLATVVLAATNVVTGVNLIRASADARADCYERMVAAARKAIDAERERETAASKAADEVKAGVARALAEGRNDASTLETRIVRVPVDGGCTWPVGMPSVQPAIDAANAAFGH